MSALNNRITDIFNSCPDGYVIQKNKDFYVVFNDVIVDNFKTKSEAISFAWKHYFTNAGISTFEQSQINMQMITKMAVQYVETAVWADSEESTNPRIPKSTLVAALYNVIAFIAKNEYTVIQLNIFCGDDVNTQIGHDFWLSSHGHGAGFFDHDAIAIENNNQDAVNKLYNSLSDSITSELVLQYSQNNGWFYL